MTDGYRVEALVDGAWSRNDITYPDRTSAEAAANDLRRRWTAVRETRVIATS